MSEYQNYIEQYKSESNRYHIRMYYDEGSVVIELSRVVHDDLEYALEYLVPKYDLNEQSFRIAYKLTEHKLDDYVGKNIKRDRQKFRMAA